ncbi:MAG TPA: DUF4238 domain-containing protein [Azospirillaceae bacterium]|nr:DUF4238 domain-containing protein [Azospirillaceae bacterium]
MSDPTNHHWLPQFLMRRWCGDDKLVNRFYRPHSKVVFGRKSPKSLGSKKNLYTSEWKRARDSFYIEKDIFTRSIDEPASIIIEKIIKYGIEFISNKERRAFSQFITTLFHRVRQNNFSTDESKEFIDFDEYVKKAKSDSSSIKDESDQYILDYYNNNIKGAWKHIWITAFLEHSVSCEMTQDLYNMEWHILKNETVEYVLGDNPVQIFGKNSKLMSVTIPISPNLAFIASKKDYFDKDVIFKKEFREIFVIQQNRKQFETARDFVISCDLGPNDGLLRIAEIYMKISDKF